MRWHNVSANKRLLAQLFLIAFLMSAAVGPSVAQALDSEVNVAICNGGNSGASLTITQPLDDSVVNQPVTTLRGEVTNATQIEIEIDGTYVSTQALASNATTFDIDITLSSGTHTIKLTGNDVCQVADASDSIVLTYQPVSEPSDGGSTPTELDGGAINSQEGQSTTVPVLQQIQQLPVIGSAVSTVLDFVESIGLPATVQGQNAFIGAARILLTVAAASTLVLAGSIAPIVLQAAPGLSKFLSSSAPRSRIYTSWLLRLGAILTMSIVYFL